MHIMNKPNLNNVRLILDSHSRMCASLPSLGFGLASSTKDGYSTVYSITEDRYKISENYKIGVVGIRHLGVPNESFYQDDLKSILKNSENPHAGFYELSFTDKVEPGDLISIPAIIENTDIVAFEVPYFVVAVESGYAFVKTAIELFQKPAQKSIWDFITQNPHWDCQKVDLCDITQKFVKLDTKNVMPGYHYDDLESA